MDKEFSTHDTYNECCVTDMLKALCEITDYTPDQIGLLAGEQSF